MRLFQNKKALVAGAGALVFLLLAGALFFNSPDRPVDTRKAGLPTLARYGALPALHDVMAKSTPLRKQVRQFCDYNAQQLFTQPQEPDRTLVKVLLLWSGQDLEGPVPKSAEGLNARVDLFLRTVHKLPPEEAIINNPLLGDRPWMRILNHAKHRLMAQCAAGAVFNGGVFYDMNDERLRAQGALSEAFVRDFSRWLKSDPQSARTSLNALLLYIDDVKGLKSLSADEQILLQFIAQDR